MLPVDEKEAAGGRGRGIALITIDKEYKKPAQAQKLALVLRFMDFVSCQSCFNCLLFLCVWRKVMFFWGGGGR